MKRKFLIGILSVLSIGIFNINPVSAERIEQNEDNSYNVQESSSEKLNNENFTEMEGDNLNLETENEIELNYSTTTGSATKINDNIKLDEEREEIRSDDTVEVASLRTEIEGIACVDDYILVKVTGYDKKGKKVVLDEDKLQYTWKSSEGDILGNQKDLLITNDMADLMIACEVTYE